METKSISWINYVRAICMFFVYFAHLENRSHFVFFERGVGIFFRPFYVSAFFVVSGYLLYRKQIQISQNVTSARCWFKEYGASYLKNILFKLAIPSILFSLLLFVPKMIIRHSAIELPTLLEQTFGGGSMWFVSALVVAQLLVLVLLFFRKFSLWLWGGYGGACLVLALLLHKLGCENFPWYYQCGMSAVFYIWLGAFLCRFELFIFSMKKVWIVVLICYVFLVYNVPFSLNLTYMDVDLQGVLLSVLSTFVLVFFCRNLQPNKFVERIGRSTIGLYFFSGAIPEFLSIVVKKSCDFNNLIFVAVLIASFFLAIILIEILQKYAAFLFDLRKLFAKK